MAKLITKIRTAGNSRVITLPADLFKETHWEVGEELELDVNDEHVEMKSTKEPTLEELLRGVPEEGLPSFEEMEGWE